MPIPYSRPETADFYEAMPDKNGEIWAGVLHGRQMVRLDPKTERWTVYQLPEPFAYDRRTWIDSSTHPVTVWYVDYNGYIVRVQPRE
jgi:streptogramin lyase